MNSKILFPSSPLSCCALALSLLMAGPAHSQDSLPQMAPLHPNAAAGLVMPYAGSGVDAWTYHYDGLRTGWNAAETALTPASVQSGKFGLLKTLAVDGTVLAQPLLISKFVMPDGSTHDVLVVVTENNSVYAYDAQSYALLWKTNLGPQQATADVVCKFLQSGYGISSTPVIVRTGPGTATLYVVASTEPAQLEFHHKVHALSLATGADLVPPTEIAASDTLSDGSTISFNPKFQWVRAGLAFANNGLYMAVSSYCDRNAAHISGWMLRYDTQLKLTNAFHTVETAADYKLASIWMSGFAPAVDTEGNLFAITGNGSFNRTGKDWSESVIKLPPSLKGVRDFFTPAAHDSLDSNDLDFGSGGVMLLPVQPGQLAPPLAVAMGKQPSLYLLDQTRLGRLKPSDAGALQSLAVGVKDPGGIFGGPAYYAGPDGGRVFYQVNGDVLRAYAVSTGAKPALSLAAQGTSPSGFGGSTPIVSSNGTTANTGVVWVIRRTRPLQLEAYDARTLGAPIYTGVAGNWPGSGAFLTPLQANGRVYVPADKTVTVFGLTP
jgi:hypothetical protein